MDWTDASIVQRRYRPRLSARSTRDTWPWRRGTLR